MFAAAGSTITQAISPGNRANSASAEERSLYSATRVSFAASGGTPRLSGEPAVSAPEPAFTSILSLCPW